MEVSKNLDLKVKHTVLTFRCTSLEVEEIDNVVRFLREHNGFGLKVSRMDALRYLIRLFRESQAVLSREEELG